VLAAGVSAKEEKITSRVHNNKTQVQRQKRNELKKKRRRGAYST